MEGVAFESFDHFRYPFSSKSFPSASLCLSGELNYEKCSLSVFLRHSQPVSSANWRV
ncbi:MAG: hypothetical protein BIFFINMI_01748 [Phycisphaerae bacterium]|nr:hypothetical protein [Phycisphaerae bacterium]